MDEGGSRNAISGEGWGMTDTDTFVDASEIFEKVKREASAKRQAEAEGIWPAMDEAAFYGLAGDVVRTIGPDSESDPVAILAQYLIPNPIDQNPWAHWRSPMDMMRQGWSTSLFHAAQQWSTRSS